MFTVKRTKITPTPEGFGGQVAGGEQSPPVAVSDLPKPLEWETDEAAYAKVVKQLDPSRVLNHFQAKRARAAMAAYIQGSQAQRPTSKQITKLSAELGYPGRPAMVAYVRFANCYPELPLTRGHFVEAIELALHGRNHWGSLTTLHQLSDCEGPLWTGHGETGAKVRAYRGSSKGRKRNPA